MSEAADSAAWMFSRIALIVTGEGEADFLPDFLRGLAATGRCSFRVSRRVEQLGPITSPTRRARMVGTGTVLPTRDVEIGLFARSCLQEQGFDFVVLIDDLEHGRRDQAGAIYGRYRQALDLMLGPDDLQAYASVHFLANMVEAYYFGHAASINSVLDEDLADYDGDVEMIRHPKGQLKQIHPGYREVADGRRIVRMLDLEHVLARPDTCAFLRTLVGWCSKAVGLPFGAEYQLEVGVYSPLTGPQIGRIP